MTYNPLKLCQRIYSSITTIFGFGNRTPTEPPIPEILDDFLEGRRELLDRNKSIRLQLGLENR